MSAGSLAPAPIHRQESAFDRSCSAPPAPVPKSGSNTVCDWARLADEVYRAVNRRLPATRWVSTETTCHETRYRPASNGAASRAKIVRPSEPIDVCSILTVFKLPLLPDIGLTERPENAATSLSLNSSLIVAGAITVPPATGLDATNLGWAAAGQGTE